MLGRLKRLWDAYRLFGRCESALEEGSTKQLSKTKVGAALAGIGALAAIGLRIESGDATWQMALPEAMGILGAVIAAFGGRDAIGKLIGK